MKSMDKKDQNNVQVFRDIKFPSERGVPERRGVFSESGGEYEGEHPVIASQCLPSNRGELAGRGVSWHELPFNPKLKQRARELRACSTSSLSPVYLRNDHNKKIPERYYSGAV